MEIGKIGQNFGVTTASADKARKAAEDAAKALIQSQNLQGTQTTSFETTSEGAKKAADASTLATQNVQTATKALGTAETNLTAAQERLEVIKDSGNTNEIAKLETQITNFAIQVENKKQEVQKAIQQEGVAKEEVIKAEEAVRVANEQLIQANKDVESAKATLVSAQTAVEEAAKQEETQKAEAQKKSDESKSPTLGDLAKNAVQQNYNTAIVNGAEQITQKENTSHLAVSTAIAGLSPEDRDSIQRLNKSKKDELSDSYELKKADGERFSYRTVEFNSKEYAEFISKAGNVSGATNNAQKYGLSYMFADNYVNPKTGEDTGINIIDVEADKISELQTQLASGTLPENEKAKILEGLSNTVKTKGPKSGYVNTRNAEAVYERNGCTAEQAKSKVEALKEKIRSGKTADLSGDDITAIGYTYKMEIAGTEICPLNIDGSLGIQEGQTYSIPIDASEEDIATIIKRRPHDNDPEPKEPEPKTIKAKPTVEMPELKMYSSTHGGKTVNVNVTEEDTFLNNFARAALLEGDTYAQRFFSQRGEETVLPTASLLEGSFDKNGDATLTREELIGTPFERYLGKNDEMISFDFVEKAAMKGGINTSATESTVKSEDVESTKALNNILASIRNINTAKKDPLKRMMYEAYARNEGVSDTHIGLFKAIYKHETGYLEVPFSDKEIQNYLKSLRALISGNGAGY